MESEGDISLVDAIEFVQKHLRKSPNVCKWRFCKVLEIQRRVLWVFIQVWIKLNFNLKVRIQETIIDNQLVVGFAAESWKGEILLETS